MKLDEVYFTRRKYPAPAGLRYYIDYFSMGPTHRWEILPFPGLNGKRTNQKALKVRNIKAQGEAL
ncbi:hypothetical protein [Cyclobacterium plantarum]|uniref:hypothetical protein n=1 Tax=Cyclobacterium plantarum TaxID=2716263 RepID=UPI003F6F12F4